MDHGTLINQRYRIVEILGKGGMGAVYRAIDENLGVEVAVKENLFTTDEYARQFRREATILASLRHPNLPRVTDHFVVDGKGQYLVMDFIEGEDLRQRMDRLGVISEVFAIQIGLAICDALHYLGSRSLPIVHRDIKPSNVKITSGGDICLVDFGLAKIIDVDQMTKTGARALTPGYSPPEQYGTSRTDLRSDIYSLGATLYSAVTGFIPEDALERAMGQTELTPVRKHNPKISSGLEQAIEKALAVRPDDRFATAEEFRQDLQKIEVGNSVPKGGMEQKKFLDIYASNIRSAKRPDGELQPVQSDAIFQFARFRPRINYLIFGVTLILGSIVLGLLISGKPAIENPISTIGIMHTNSFFQGTKTKAGLSSGSLTGTPSLNIATTESTLTAAITQTMAIPGMILTTGVPISKTTPASPTPVGGGNGQIAFVSNRSGINQIWVMKQDGTGLVQITDMEEGACQPDWSPDGMRLVFTSPCYGNDEFYPGAGLFLINYDGTNLTPLPSVPGGDFDPAWSPDGQFIVFSSLRASGWSRLYLFNLDNYEITRLSEKYNRDGQPAWSSNGKMLAYVSRQDGPYSIWTMNIDGSQQKRYSQSGARINMYPDWSNDLEVIIFTQYDKAGGVPFLTAATQNEEGYQELRFNIGPVPAREARYSPDGLWIIFEAWPDGKNHDIYIMSATGAGRTRMTDFTSVEYDPVWRPVVQHQ